MVDFKCRIYDGDNNQMIGAEVTVYSNTGENIGTIQVTSKKDFDDLVARLDGFDEKYLSKSELEEEVNNLTLNASTLTGYNSSDFALANHSHGDSYAPVPHNVNTNVYGLGTNSLYGHVKIVNNLNSSNYIDGEVLSAYQGKVLSDKISAVSKNMGSWTKVQSDTYLTVYYNSALKMCWAVYSRKNYTGFKSKSKESITLHSKNTIKSAYQPHSEIRSSAYRADTVFSVTSAGAIEGRAENTISSMDIHVTWFWTTF